MIKIDIEDITYSLLVDLGSSHPIDLRKKAMQKIKNKKRLGISNYIGIRGKKYPTQGFALPKIKLLNLTIEGLVGFEENLEFIDDARTWRTSGLWSRLKEQLEVLTLDGRMGWTVFKKGVCFFDFPHSAIIIANDMTSFINETVYFSDDFMQIPFEIQKWGIAISAKTDLGIQKFQLDTGATCSIIKKSLISKNVKKGYVTQKIRIGSRDFGDWKFRLFECTDQIQCDGIFGIDFFKKHQVVLDFPNQIAYIRRVEDLGERFTSLFAPISDSHAFSH